MKRLYFAFRNAIYEFRRTMWRHADFDRNWEIVQEIPDQKDDDHISKERGGIYHRRGNTVFHAYHYHFTKHEFPSERLAVRYMTAVALFVED